jgi:basic membrane lipoprotein Med (substrate-binding protein (PBP1-ABC) superfamily)
LIVWFKLAVTAESLECYKTVVVGVRPWRELVCLGCCLCWFANLCRLPGSIKTPAGRSGVSMSQFSKWLDQHSATDVGRSVASALEAAKADVVAAAAAGPGPAAVIALMRQLCGMTDT